MGTTIVMRGDEWVASLPIHVQLFNACDFKLPRYGHVAPVMKLDGESRRKLSKRKDPESSAEYYLELGYPVKALYVYLYTLLNSNFEEWYLANPNADLSEFNMTFENMSISGALYDLTKLNSISSEIIYNTSVEDNVNNQLAWAKEYDKELYSRLTNDLELTTRLFKTQGPESSEHRKDLNCYHDFLHVFGSLYTDIFESNTDVYNELIEENLPKEIRSEIVSAFINYFTEMENGSEKTLKELSKELGYTDKKKYAKNPEMYRGVITQFYKGLRLLLTHQEHGIAMDDIISVLGYDEVKRRLAKEL
jgi:glutamyl-tRNA synthetase